MASALLVKAATANRSAATKKSVGSASTSSAARYGAAAKGASRSGSWRSAPAIIPSTPHRNAAQLARNAPANRPSRYCVFVTAVA